MNSEHTSYKNIPEARLPPKVQCTFCNKEFDRKYFRQHMAIHTKENIYFCQHCSMECSTAAAWRNHENLHSMSGKLEERPRPFKCTICPKAFTTRQHLRNHGQVHQSEFLFKCEQCGKALKSKASLDLHTQRIHENIKPFACSFCPKKFFQRGLLATHIKVHTGEKSHKCQKCNNSFGVLSQLQKHIINIHTDVPIEHMHSCEQCKKQFKSKAHLKGHIRTTHTTRSPQECGLCNKEFKTRQCLNRHLKTHTAEKTFECKYCAKMFASGSTKLAHEKIHFPKQLKCSVCDKKFRHTHNLKRHMISHNEEQYVTCVFCPKALKSLEYSISHIRTHLKERPHICSFCQMEFSNWNTHRNHVRNCSLLMLSAKELASKQDNSFEV